jgi:DNA-binding transcriptional LysR family regulator
LLPRLRVGFVPGVTLTKWRRIWGERLPRTSLEIVEVAEADQRNALDEARVDMCFVRLPLADQRLHVIPLYDEVPVVVVAKDHPAALFDEVTLADLSDEVVIDPADTRNAFELAAGGVGVLFLPHSIARSHSRRDLVYRTISDASPTWIALAWRVDNPNELIEDFIGVVRGRTPNSSRNLRPGRASDSPPTGRRSKDGKTSQDRAWRKRPASRRRRNRP